MINKIMAKKMKIFNSSQMTIVWIKIRKMQIRMKKTILLIIKLILIKIMINK